MFKEISLEMAKQLQDNQIIIDSRRVYCCDINTKKTELKWKEECNYHDVVEGKIKIYNAPDDVEVANRLPRRIIKDGKEYLIRMFNCYGKRGISFINKEKQEKIIMSGIMDRNVGETAAKTLLWLKENKII